MDQQARLALADLRARGLLSFRARSGNEEPTWAASERGRAVYESALPTRQGERLYEVRPTRARTSGICWVGWRTSQSIVHVPGPRSHEFPPCAYIHAISCFCWSARVRFSALN